MSPRTVIEALLPGEGSTSAATIYEAAGTVGISDHALRLALHRLVTSGDIVQHGRGRTAQLTLTATGRARLDGDRLGLALAFAQDSGEYRWDRHWHLISVSTPETDRAVRDRLRRALTAAGAAQVSTALFVSPHDLQPMLDSDARRHTVCARAEQLSLHEVSDPIAITEQLWPAARIIGAYDPVAVALERDNSDHNPTARRLYLAQALENAIRNDPLIPPELRAEPWYPSTLRLAWQERWHAIPQASPAVYGDWLSVSSD